MKRVSSRLVAVSILYLSMMLLLMPYVKADVLYSDFESGFGDWQLFTQAGGTVQRSTTFAHSGAYSVEQLAHSSGSESINTVGAIRLPVTSTSVLYELSSWVYVTERSDYNARSFFGFSYDGEIVGWDVWGTVGSYVQVRYSEGYQKKGDIVNPVPYGLTLNTWHQVEVIAYTNLGKASVWLDGSLIVDSWPAFNAGDKPDFWYIDCLSNYFGNFVAHHYIDDVSVSYTPISAQTPVGGEWSPITMQTLSPPNTLQMLAPMIGLISLMTLLTTSFVYIRRKRRQS